MKDHLCVLTRWPIKVPMLVQNWICNALAEESPEDRYRSHVEQGYHLNEV